jgi:adenosylhomocysteine nucleosidase
MNDPSKPTRGGGWAFLFALQRESIYFRRLLQFTASIPDAPCNAGWYESPRGTVLVMETGVGARCARDAVQWLFNEYEPQMVVACGFAGALSPTLQVGDVLLASEVVEPGEDDLHWRTTVPAELGDLPVGRILTAPRLVANPADKKSFARQTGAIAVDMESAAIAEACQEHRVPCAVVRTISDTANTALSPRLVEMSSGGDVAPWRALAAMAKSPRLAVEFWRLARDTRLAARRLADALHRLTDH